MGGIQTYLARDIYNFDYVMFHTSLLLYLRKHLAAAENGSVLTEQVTVLKDVVNRVRRDQGIMVAWGGMDSCTK